MPNDATPDQSPDYALPIWEQQIKLGESDARYSWFHVYLLMGPSRSVVGAYSLFHRQKSQKVPASPSKIYGSASPSWKAASKIWNWLVRASAWDAEQRVETEKLAEQLREERVKATMDDGYEGGAEMVEKGREILKLKVSAANHNYFSVAGRLIKDGTETRRKALDLDHERISDEEVQATLNALVARARGLASRDEEGEDSAAEDDDEDDD